MNKLVTVCVLVCLASALSGVRLHAGSLASLYERGFVDLELDLEIGGDDTDEETVLFGPTAVDIDSHGNIFVMDYKLFCIKKYDPSGGYLSSIGRHGEGPGEFLQPSGMAIYPDDRMLTFDYNNHRFQTFDADGEYSSSLTFQGFITNMEIGPTGEVYAGVQHLGFSEPNAPTILELVRFSSDFSRKAVIDSMRVQFMKTIALDGGMTSASVPFPPYLVWALTPDVNLVVGHSNEYRLILLSPQLEELGVFSRDIAPPRITEEDREDYFESFMRPGQAGLHPKLKAAITFPGSKPYYDDIVVDSEGNILVRWSDPDEDDVPVFDAFSPSGEFIARVKIAEMGRGAFFRGGFTYSRHRPEDELPTVRRYRVQ